MHALLFRKWKTRVKGRDWFDLEWYVRKGVPLHLDHLLRRAQDSGDWKEKKMTEKQLRALVKQKIAEVTMEQAKADAIKFILDPATLKIWSSGYFNDLVSKMKISA